MTVDMLLNIFLLLYFQNIYFILAAGNLGYMLSHVIALSGILLLRRDRANWPRPIKLGKAWMWLAGLLRPERDLHHLRAVRAEVHGLRLRLPERGVRRGHGQPDGASARIVIVGVLVLVAGVVGYIIAQRQWGKPVRWKDQATSSRRRRRSTAQPPSPPAPASRNANRPERAGKPALSACGV